MGKATRRKGTSIFLRPRKESGTSRQPDPVIQLSTETRRVFRIEHPESGQGPFTHQGKRVRFASDAMRLLKEPQDFNVTGVSLTGGGWHYAFDSAERMMGAIDRFVLLREEGFHFAVYDTSYHVVLPDGQVAFDKTTAVLVGTHECHEFPYEDYF